MKKLYIFNLITVSTLLSYGLYANTLKIENNMPKSIKIYIQSVYMKNNNTLHEHLDTVINTDEKINFTYKDKIEDITISSIDNSFIPVSIHHDKSDSWRPTQLIIGQDENNLPLLFFDK